MSEKKGSAGVLKLSEHLYFRRNGNLKVQALHSHLEIHPKLAKLAVSHLMLAVSKTTMWREYLDVMMAFKKSNADILDLSLDGHLWTEIHWSNQRFFEFINTYLAYAANKSDVVTNTGNSGSTNASLGNGKANSGAGSSGGLVLAMENKIQVALGE
eukprot:Awhi_evm1s8546